MMMSKCDHCLTSQAVIYCKSDLAKLCQTCDFHIHSANPLSLRHPRYLICEKCFSQSDVTRCVDNRVSNYQGCHCQASNFKLQNPNRFSDCPYPTEFLKTWCSVLEPSPSGLLNPFISLPSNDPSPTMFGMGKMKELDDLIGSSCSMTQQDITYTQNLSDEPSFFPLKSKGCSDLVMKLEEDEEDLCEGLNLENAPLNFDFGDDIIKSSSQNHIESDHTMSNCLMMDKSNTSVTASNFTIDNTLEVSFQALSPGQQDSTSSSLLQMNINNGLPPLPLPSSPVLFGQIHPTMSFTLSNITGESSVADHNNQDYGLSGSPWEPNLEVSSPHTRHEAMIRYREKKLKRTFGKQIRYASRKARADTRKRVKGRFVKAGDNYDYDPSSPTSTTNH